MGSPKSIRNAIKQLNRWRLQLQSSSPILGLVLFGIACLFSGPESFGPGHNAMFRYIPPATWGVSSSVVGLAGYYGLFFKKRQLWLWAHSFASFVLGAIAFSFLYTFLVEGLGGPTVAGLAFGLALNAEARAEGQHKDPFNDCIQRRGR